MHVASINLISSATYTRSHITLHSLSTHLALDFLIFFAFTQTLRQRNSGWTNDIECESERTPSICHLKLTRRETFSQFKFQICCWRYMFVCVDGTGPFHLMRSFTRFIVVVAWPHLNWSIPFRSHLAALFFPITSHISFPLELNFETKIFAQVWLNVNSCEQRNTNQPTHHGKILVYFRWTKRKRNSGLKFAFDAIQN